MISTPVAETDAPGFRRDGEERKILQEMTARERNGLYASIVVMGIGQVFSFKLAGRFAVSNAFQIVSLLFLLRAFPRILHGRDVAYIVLSIASTLAAGFAMSSIYGYALQPQFSLFFLAVGLYLVIIFRVVHERDAYAILLSAYRATVAPVFFYLILRAVVDIVLLGQRFSPLGFDDKSHAAVVCCFYAFLALRTLAGRHRLLVSLVFFGLSLLTISRLPAFFAPFLIFAFFVEYKEIRRAARNAFDVYADHLILLAGIVLPAIVAVRWSGLFLVAGRLADAGVDTNDSTAAHLILVRLAAQIKTANAANFFLGITPGGFAGVLYRSGINISGLAGLDPNAYAAIVEGSAPMHSSHMSILVEFPAPVALAYVALWIWIFRSLRRQERVLGMLALGFFAATSFYSSHNELYFYAVLSLMIAAAANKSVRRDALPRGKRRSGTSTLQTLRRSGGGVRRAE